MSPQVVVIGGGISGLACAYRLWQLGVPVTLLEADERAGGLIGTVEQEGFLFETGPQSFQGTDSALDLVRELGLESDLCQADPRAPRYVMRQGRLQELPMSPQAVLRSSLLGMGARWKLATEALRKTKPPTEEESVAQFVRRKFGHEILEYLVSPFVSGVYAGDPEKLSLRAAFPPLDEWERTYGSVLRGAMKSRPAKGAGQGRPPLCSFNHGMASLTRTMAAKLGESARLGACVDAVTRNDRDGSARYQISFTEKGRMETIEARAVVIATPAYMASHLVSAFSAPLARALSGIAYAGMAVVGAGYHATQVGTVMRGFGVLIPRSEKYRTLGIVWNSSLFPDRSGEGRTTLTSFVGGATDPELIEKRDEEILAIVQDEAARILAITGQPIVSRVWKHPKALPQYNLGHGHNVQAVRENEREIPGLYFVGNYLEGPSISKCVDGSSQAAETVRAYLRDGTAKSA
jgi:protoporphyrinogen/coproporphyrinogen III oxidase